MSGNMSIKTNKCSPSYSAARSPEEDQCMSLHVQGWCKWRTYSPLLPALLLARLQPQFVPDSGLEMNRLPGMDTVSLLSLHHYFLVFFRVSLPLSLLSPVIGLVSIKRSQSTFLIVLWVTACKWHHRGSLMGCNVSSLECSNVVPSLHENNCQSPTRLHFSRHHLSISDFRRSC